MTRLLDNMKLSALAAAIALCMPSSLAVSRESLTNLQLPLQAPKTMVEVPVMETPPVGVELAEPRAVGARAVGVVAPK